MAIPITKNGPLIPVLISLLAVAWATSVEAHRLRPAVVTLTLDPAGSYQADIVLNMEAVLAGINPSHQDTDESPNARRYDQLREMQPAELTRLVREYEADYLGGVHIAFDGQEATLRLTNVQVPEVGDTGVERLTTLTLLGKAPAGTRQFTWRYAADYGASALRVGRTGDAAVRTAFLDDGQISEPFSLRETLQAKSTWQVTIEYIALGFTHILPKGTDHILFVLGIYLLSQRWKPLLLQVTAFTVAHTITLALSLYGVISLSPSIVEPLIALSIVYVAVENILTPNLKPWRVFVVFGFGLLHGMGFAGVLRELGLPRDEYVTALIAFNVGVEFGQLAVIAAAFLATGLWFRHRAWYRRVIVIPASLTIALVGAYWTIERTVG
jgi:hydrogenase/urease accessory protein HupE